MDVFKRAVWIIGGILVLVCLILVAVCLWALNKKADNSNKIAPAMKNRWKPKDDDTNENSKVDTAIADNRNRDRVGENGHQLDHVNGTEGAGGSGATV